MTFLKKQSIGFYLNVLVIVVSIVGTVMYLANCKTSYFANLGVNTSVVICFCAAVVLELIYVIGNEAAGRKMILDICPVVSTALVTIATVLFLSARVNGIAAIMTFTNNASTMRDLNHTILSLVFCVIAIVAGMAASFFDVVKED